MIISLVVREEKTATETIAGGLHQPITATPTLIGIVFRTEHPDLTCLSAGPMAQKNLQTCRPLLFSEVDE